jgi:hypothetical protein
MALDDLLSGSNAAKPLSNKKVKRTPRVKTEKVVKPKFELKEFLTPFAKKLISKQTMYGSTANPVYSNDILPLVMEAISRDLTATKAVNASIYKPPLTFEVDKLTISLNTGILKVEYLDNYELRIVLRIKGKSLIDKVVMTKKSITRYEPEEVIEETTDESEGQSTEGLETGETG